jgi:hypothetical protein
VVGRAERAVRAHGAPLVTAVLELHRQAGNRAVTEILQREPDRATGSRSGGGGGVPQIGPAPVAIAPGSALPHATAGTTAQPLGTTRTTSSTPPHFALHKVAATKQYAAGLEPTSAGDVQIEARYPAPGLFNMPAGEKGQPRRAIVDDTVSALVRDGEQEHSNDFHLAYHTVYDRVAAVINGLATQPAKCGPNVGAVHAKWRQALHDALPPVLRAPVGDISPNTPWNALVSRLNGLSGERDDNHWHDMGLAFATYEDKKANPVPEGVELLRVTPGGEIGPHGSQARIDAAAPGVRGP